MKNKRNYLIYEDVCRDATWRPIFEACVARILDGEIRHVSKTRAEKGYSSYPCFRVDGKEVLVDAVLEYYLYESAKTGFRFEEARRFTDVMRRLCGWKWDVDRTLRGWVNRVIRDPFFYDAEGEDSFHAVWKLRPGEPSYSLPEDFFRFAAYIAVCHTKYGMSFDSLTTEEIFSWLTALGSDLPAQLKKHGSGELARDVAEYKDNAVSCQANDAFALVRIAVKEETEESYRKVLNFLCRLLESEFPRSYAIEFRSSGKCTLPVKGLPKKGVHHLFANAMQWAALHPLVERYARLAMKEAEWYLNLEAEHCAMPGTFAVFALGLSDECHHRLVCDYLEMCDGEHQSLHGKFLVGYIEKFGFTEKAKELYDLCEANIQHLPSRAVTLRKAQSKAK